MPWKPLPAVAFAICTYPFRATGPDDLPLQIGDHIYIIEQSGNGAEWYRGYLVAPPSVLAGLTSEGGQQLEHRVFSGIFPRNCVEVREFLGETQINGLGRPSGAPDGDDMDPREKRKSQAQYARRMSRRLSKKKSARDLGKKQSVLIPHEPMPRDPHAPKPLAPVPLLRVGDETGQSAEEPLVDEIASCLREWHDARLHEVLLARGYSQLARVQDLIKRVDNSRNQLMHDVMTLKELEELREDTVWDLVAGNKLLYDDVIVRSPTEKGRILTADDSVIEMTKLQANMSILDRPPKPPMDTHALFHLLVDVRNLVFESDQPATLQMYLCLKEHGEKPQPISDSFSIALPVPETLSSLPEDQTKTLFVNLNSTDVGAGAEFSSLYILFKLLKDEPARQPGHGQGAGHQQSSQPQHQQQSTPQMLKNTSVKGRRSVFGSQRKKETNHGRHPSEPHNRPETSLSERSEGEGRQSNATNETPASREVKMVRRTVGIGAIEVGKLAQANASLERGITFWAPCSAAEDRSDDGDDWVEIIRELARSPTGTFNRVKYTKRCDVFVKAFASTDLDDLIRRTPTLLHEILMTPKIGFSGVPKGQRSDIYLTLTEPLVPRNATLAHSKFGAVPLSQRSQTSLANLQLTLEVRKADGERIDDCIFTSSNHQGHTAWRTTGIERGEGWNQTIRLEIPVEDVPGSHVVMSIADSPNFPFALAWVPLWENEAFVRDGDHTVALYVYDEYSSSIIAGKGAYLALPPWHDKNDTSQSNATIVTLKTYLCSTEYSQDPTILGVLNWRNFHGERLLEVLERFAHVPEIEIVKLLRNCFAALFEILHEYETTEEYEDVVFYDFVVLLNIARDKRFELANIIEDYATTRFKWPYASQCLVRAYRRLVSNPLDTTASRKLRATLKVSDQMLRLIVDTTRRRPSADPESSNNIVKDRHPDFKKDIERLFVAIMALLRNPMPVLLGTQTLLVQHFHTWLPELASVMTATEILEIATDLMDSCAHAKGKMILHRLILVINYSRIEIFKAPEVRTTLIANTFRWLAPCWGHTHVVSDQWHDQVRLCCSAVATQMQELGEESCQYVPKLTESFMALQRIVRRPKRTFSMLFPTSYPFPAKPTTQDIEVDEAILEISALLAAALTSDRKLYFDASQVDIMGVLLQALQVGHNVLSCEAFPRSWLSLLVSHHKYGMTALERISEVLVDSLPNIYAQDSSEALEFDTDIWRAFFGTLFTALGSPALAMETYPEQKRRAIWKVAGDVRELGAIVLKRSWEAIGWETEEEARKLHGFEKLGGYQVQFVPELVAPVVELCLSVHASLRNVSVEILRSMIISAWEIDQDLATIQTAMIDCLDRLCRTKHVTEVVLQKTFVPEMMDQFKNFQHTVEDGLYTAVLAMFSKIEALLGMLGNLHQGAGVGDATKLVDTLRLMEFLKNVQSEEAYVRYVHQLADMQIAAGYPTEAGLALQMHADRHEWDPSRMLEALVEPRMPAQTAFERKEALYFQMCQHFEKGKAWQRALMAYRQLAHQYEQNTFEFSKVARTQRAIAGILERIAKGDRSFSRFFRVTFRGLGFPPNVRNKDFIFEGFQSDRLSTFHDRLQQLYPAAQILRSGEDAGMEGQYLHIYAVSQNKDVNHLVYQRLRVTQAVREYNLMSNPNKFTTTSRQAAPDVPITDQLVEKVVYTTAERFPTISRRSEVVSVESATLTPIEAAVDRTTRKTQELLAMEKQIASGEDEGSRARLVEDILASVGTNSDSSVARYRHLLPQSEQGDKDSAEIDPSDYGRDDGPPLDTIQSALKVALLDHALAIRRCLGLFSRPAHLATKAELLPRFEATFAPELAILYPGVNGLVEHNTPRSSVADYEPPAVHQPPTSAGAGQGEEQQAGTEKTHSRRMSIPFLRRASSKQENVNGAAESGGRKSRDESRSGGGRERSLSRRISLFRNNSDDGRQGAPNGNGSNTLRKRLSLLKGSEAPQQTTSTGEYVG